MGPLHSPSHTRLVIGTHDFFNIVTVAISTEYATVLLAPLQIAVNSLAITNSFKATTEPRQSHENARQQNATRAAQYALLRSRHWCWNGNPKPSSRSLLCACFQQQENDDDIYDRGSARFKGSLCPMANPRLSVAAKQRQKHQIHTAKQRRAGAFSSLRHAFGYKLHKSKTLSTKNMGSTR